MNFKWINPNKKWIVYDNNKIMQQKINDLSLPLNETDIEIINKMISYVDASYNNQHQLYDIVPGIGIAAIQIGYPKKIIYIHLDDQNKEYKYLLANPVIIQKSANKAYLENGEGCLSVEKKHEGLSIRSAIVVVKAIDLYTLKPIEIKATHLLAACLQHEVDHNNNMFYYHRINPLNPFFIEKNWIKI